MLYLGTPQQPLPSTHPNIQASIHLFSVSRALHTQPVNTPGVFNVPSGHVALFMRAKVVNGVYFRRVGIAVGDNKAHGSATGKSVGAKSPQRKRQEWTKALISRYYRRGSHYFGISSRFKARASKAH